jgi:hypothetical protein
MAVISIVAVSLKRYLLKYSKIDRVAAFKATNASPNLVNHAKPVNPVKNRQDSRIKQDLHG